MEKFSKFKQENDPYIKEVVDKIKVYFPEFVKDGRFDIQSFNNLFQNKDFIANEQENYGFFWNGKNKLFQIINSNSLLSLKPNYEKSIDFKNSKNIIIEGDNLEVLKLLKSSYFEKIDVIYIDPPYNTGNDFVYNDKYKMSKSEYDESIENSNIKNSHSEGRYHTNWLNMIYPRLKLAKSLLKDDGIIFISIDDNEQSRLKIICDEIFGEHNFVNCFVWQHKSGGGNDEKFFVNEHEYILAYSKNISSLKIKNKYIDVDKKEFNYKVGDNLYKLIPLVKWGAGENDSFKTLRYPILDNSGKEYWPTKPNGSDGRWRKKPENCDLIVWKENKNNINTPYEAVLYSNDKKIKKEKTILLNYDVGTTSDGTKELSGLLGVKIDKMFPKPLELIKFLINIKDNSNSLVLDFFAGSGTTGQAVMELNKEDGNNRNFILVQLPEKIESERFHSITDITRERIIRSINKFEYKEKGFKYFELVSSNFIEIDSEIEPSFFDSKFKKGTEDIDLLYEIMLKISLDLNLEFEEINIDGCKYFVDSTKTYIFSISNSNNTDLLIKHLENIKEGYHEAISNLYIKEELFSDDKQKINIFKEIQTKFENTSVVVL